MFARTRTLFAVRDSALVVPEEALVPQGGKQFLIKVVDGPQGKVSQRLEARIGVRVPGKVEILDGVTEGDLVVTAGQGRLLRGDSAAGARGRSGRCRQGARRRRAGARRERRRIGAGVGAGNGAPRHAGRLNRGRHA